MRLSTLLAAAGFGLAVLGVGPAQALTYDTHLSRNGDGSAGFQDPDDGLKAHFGVTGDAGSQDSGDRDTGFVNSSDHNFSPPDPGVPFGGLIPGQPDR